MTHARAARMARIGGPEVIEWIDVDLPDPAPGEVRMRTTAVGLNFIDTYFRSGLYPSELPSGLGSEAAGVVEAVGDGVDLTIGTRVATFGPTRGAYATARNVPSAQLFRIPAGIDDETAAAVLLKGCTTEFLVERAARLTAGDWVLVHAAAGGVGLLLVQWLKARGARVIGTVGSDAKVQAALTAGADAAIVSSREDVAARVRALTHGAGVRVTYDGVGKDTWAASLDATGRRGLIVSYGNASGAVTDVALGVLAAKGSLFCTRPTLFDYYADPQDSATGIAALWDMIQSGKLAITIGQRYALEDAAQAHTDLEARRTHGSTILLP